MARKTVSKQTAEKTPVEPRIVEAVGSAAGFGHASSDKGDFTNRIQNAMTEATAKAQAEGVTDPDEILARKLEARRRVKEEDARARAAAEADAKAAAEAAQRGD
jgi:hypothetical protein